MLSDVFNIENSRFKPFKKGDRLLNRIFTQTEDNIFKVFLIFSSSKCKKKMVCKLKIDTSKTTLLNIKKLENLLKMYTWNLSNGNLKTTENGVQYTFTNLLSRHHILLSYSVSVSPLSSIHKIYSLLLNSISQKNIST